MFHVPLMVVEIVFVALAISALGYYALCLWSAAAFLRSQQQFPNVASAQNSLPAVSVLKPLKGVDHELYKALRSHCLQDYAEYEIIFGVNDSADPALEIVQRLIAEFPQRSIQCVLCEKDLGANTKVSNLAQMVLRARYDYLVVSDSDIYVPQDYLARVMRPLHERTVGAVTCLYGGTAGSTFGSRLESLGISTDFAAGVLVARYLEGGLRFGFGSTLAFRRRDLDAIGGFENFVNHLADDYELASQICDLGLRVHLSELIVQTFLPAYKFGDFMRHQVRWARGIRDCRPGGYAGLIFTFGVPWALLAFAVSRAAPWSWALLLATLLLRFLTADVVGRRVLGDDHVLHLLWLVPLRDILALVVWIFSFAGNTVIWRGKCFYLKHGKLVRMGLDISR